MGPSLQTERTRKSILLGYGGSKPCAGLLLWGPSSFGPSRLRPASRDRPPVIARAGPNAMPHRPVPSLPVAASRAATASTTPGTAIARKGPAGIHFGARWVPAPSCTVARHVRLKTAAAWPWEFASPRRPPVGAWVPVWRFLPRRGNLDYSIPLQVSWRHCR